MSLKVDILQGGTNSHGVTVDDLNAFATDLLSNGVIGPIGSGATNTGSFALNAQVSPDMTLACTAGTAYVLGTPTSGVSQRVRVVLSANMNITIASNATGSTRYDWIYIKLDPDKMQNPAVDSSDVATLVSSRSTSSSVDNGTAPTYGYCIGVITVANGAATMTQSVITDKRSICAVTTNASAQGWAADVSPTYASVDGPTQTFTLTGNVTTNYYPGVRYQYQQQQAIQNYWSFDTDFTDSKGSATMANIGTPTYTAGKFSNALTLNGTNQALSITSSASFTTNMVDEVTIGKWFKTSNTGAIKTMFQSWSKTGGNAQGIQFNIDASNHLSFLVGNNTSASAVSTISGTTTVTDGVWHYAEVCYRDNQCQVYLDGRLEASGYIVTPVFNATNYVRIGCASDTGNTLQFFNGQIDDLFIAAYALDEQTIAAKYAAATAQGTGDLTLTKYALVTASSYSSPNTTVTIYSGTDYMMTNSTVSNAYYSTQKAPYGFPLGQDKWTTQFQDTSDEYKNSPAQNTYYGQTNAWSAGGAGLVNVPIGKWKLSFDVSAYHTRASGYTSVTAVLSTQGAAASNPRLKAYAYGSSLVAAAMQLHAEDTVTTYVKTPYYLLLVTDQSSATTLGFSGAINVIRATSTLL